MTKALAARTVSLELAPVPAYIGPWNMAWATNGQKYGNQLGTG